MKPGGILIFLAVLSLCGAAIQMASPILQTVKNESPPAYWIIGLLCLSLGIALPYLAARFWNRTVSGRGKSE